MIKSPKHIIIDGADGLGKTTICTKLGRSLSLPVIKMPNMKEYVEKNSPEEFSKLFNETIVQFSEFEFILDRGFTSSIAYSEAHDRDFNLSYIDRIENMLQPMVFILTGRISGENRWNYFREDDVFDEDQTVRVDQEFLSLAARKGYEVIEVNGKSPDAIIHMIMTKVYGR